ncbi:MAG: BamA/TamA family outer membrane protein [Povalibacter sp.]
MDVQHALRFVHLLALFTACSLVHAEEPAPQKAPDTRPSFVLLPSNTAGDPSNPMSNMEVIGDLDQGADTADKPAGGGHWVIAPIPFRNELLGAGLVLGAGYLYDEHLIGDESRHSVAALAGMYAEGGSWAAMGGHRGYWSEDRFRTTVGAVTGEIQYSIALDVAEQELRVPIAQGLSAVSIEGSMKIGHGGWIGLGFLGGTTDISLRGQEPAPIDGLTSSSTTDLAAIRLSGEFDTRDSDLYPRHGHYAELLLSVSREEFSSDDDYEILEMEWNDYIPLTDSQVLAWRIAGKTVDGETPFYAKAWFGSGADLRGYTPGRYIADSMISAQAEWRLRTQTRWGFVAFAGVGKVADAIGAIDTDQWLPAAGAGIRFKLSESLPLNLRADFGWGRDDSTFTLAVGEAF